MKTTKKTAGKKDRSSSSRKGTAAISRRTSTRAKTQKEKKEEREEMESDEE